jgi:hypothetical protein
MQTMPHLSPERIAALVDEPASGSERAHFEQCAHCRADFVAMRRIVEAAGAERERPIAPLVPWSQLAGALRDEGLLSGPRASLTVSSAPVEVRPITSAPSLSQVRGDGRGRRLAPWMRVLGMAAAAGLLVTAGVVGGRMSLARGAVSDASPATSIPVTAGIPLTNVAQFQSSDDARATLHSAEQVYSGALLWLAAHDSALAPRAPAGSEAAAMNYRERLEVLDAAMATARRALYEAPDDPVMNRYYLATLGAREVTLRRLTTVLPASQQVLEY